MKKYDYKKEMVKDIKEYIKDNPHEWTNPHTTDDVFDYWYDILWAEDCITGNGYDWYDTEDKCSEYLSNNFDLLYEAAREYGMDDDVNILIQHYQNKTLARYFDCTIRCYLLGECLMTALEELNNATD